MINKIHLPNLNCLFWTATLTLCATVAQAECEFRIERAEEALRTSAITYDVFNVDGISKQFDVSIRRIDKTESQCDIKVQVKKQGAFNLVNSSQSSLTYRLLPATARTIYDNKTVFMEQKNIDNNAIISFSYKILIPGEQFVSPGVYQDQLLLTVLKLNGSDDDLSSLYEQRKVVISTEVEPAARISFAGTQGRSQTVDFGELSNGKTISPAPQIVIQSTGHYLLKFSSENRGVLRHESAKSKWDIPYQAIIGNRPIKLTTETAILNYTEPSTITGQRLPVSLSIPYVGDRPAGIYEDIIRVTIAPDDLSY